MDKVRFGRALGKGARSAAKSLMEAADAAASPDPRPKANTERAEYTARHGEGRGGGARVHEVVESVVQAHRVVTETKKQARTAGMKAAAPVLANAKRLSRVLWLEVTGCFFALFALFLGGAVWKSRGAWRGGANSVEAHKLYFYAVVFVVFAYFAVSSFVKAKRLERQ